MIGTAAEVRSWATEYIALLDAQDPTGAMEYFIKDMPRDFAQELKSSPIWEDLIAHAKSLRADAEALAWFHSAPLPQLLEGISQPVLSMVGDSTFDVMHEAADAIIEALRLCH